MYDVAEELANEEDAREGLAEVDGVVEKPVNEGISADGELSRVFPSSVCVRVGEMLTLEEIAMENAAEDDTVAVALEDGEGLDVLKRVTELDMIGVDE